MKPASDIVKNIEYKNLPVPQTEEWKDMIQYLDNELGIIGDTVDKINDSLLAIRTYLGI